MKRQVVTNGHLIAATVAAIETGRTLKNKTGDSDYRIAATCAPACVHIWVRQTLNGQTRAATHVIAAADAIYGVTMQERGVSRTLSMKFDQSKGAAEVLPVTIADAVRSAAPSAPAQS